MFSSVDLHITQKPRFVPNLHDLETCGAAALPHAMHSLNPHSFSSESQKGGCERKVRF